MTNPTDDPVRIERVKVWRVYWGSSLVGAAGSLEDARELADSVRGLTNGEPPPVKPKRAIAKKGAVTKAAKKRMAATKPPLRPKKKPARNG